MECQNKTCYLTFMCNHKNQAENCAIHQWYLNGENVILDYDLEFERKKYIPFNDCLEGHLYKIFSLDGIIGLFLHKKFYISKCSCGFNYIEKENHYDSVQDWGNGIPIHGTVKPYEDLGETPHFKKDDDILRYLNNKTIEINFNQIEKISEKTK